jgi:branched-chain amino acid transport system permease protein
MEQMLSSALFVLLYGVSYGLVLFIISMGLVITMGLMQIVNLAHGAFAAIGGYVAVSLMNAAGVPFLATLCAAVVVVVLFSFVLERLIYVRLYGASHLDQILMTLGVNFIVIGAITILFGPNVYPVRLPGFLQGSVDLGLRHFEVYRIFIICLGLAVVVCLWRCSNEPVLAPSSGLRWIIDRLRRSSASTSIDCSCWPSVSEAVWQHWGAPSERPCYLWNRTIP